MSTLLLEHKSRSHIPEHCERPDARHTESLADRRDLHFVLLSLHVHLMRCDGKTVRLRKRDQERIGSREEDALCIVPEVLLLDPRRDGGHLRMRRRSRG